MPAHTAVPATKLASPDYLFRDIASDERTWAEERDEVVDAVRQAISRQPDADCLAACMCLMQHLEKASAIMQAMESASQPSAFGLSTIGQIATTVTDVDRAVQFYRDTLGIPLLFQMPAMAFFDCGGVRLMLSGSEKQETYSSILYFKVPDIQSAADILKARGVAFERDPHLLARMPGHDLFMAFFRDPDRNLLALMSEVPRPS